MPILETWDDVLRELSRNADPDWRRRQSDVMAALHFTPREKQIADLLLRGETRYGMATELGLSSWTVHRYTSEIYYKLGVNNRVSAALALVGIHPEPDPPPER